MNHKIVGVVSAAILASTVGIALASSPSVWKAFREDVREKCDVALRNVLASPEVIVDPFGASSSGIALGVGESKYSKEQLVIVCMYDKHTQKVELGSEIKLNDIAPYKKLLDENIQLREHITKDQQGNTADTL